MNPHRTITRSAATALGIAAYVALSAVALGCGGSNNSSTTTTTVVAVFTPDTTTPLDGSITMLSGTTSGASVNVRVTVTQVASFFGTAFRIAYDPAALLFNGMDDSSSFLRAGVTESDVLFDVNSANTAGELVITATRLDPTVAPPVNVTVTSDLVILNFVARQPIAPNTAQGRLEFADPKEACDGSVFPCGPVAVTWSGGNLSAQ